MMERLFRQEVVGRWAKKCFGENTLAVKERSKRLLEEALELAQAGGVPLEEVLHLSAYTYGRPVGQLSQEIGGVAVCLLALGYSANIDVDQVEQDEILRVVSKPDQHWVERHNAKAAKGVAEVVQ
ncbi:hypothetical protein [Inquilinus limosus]|uniref:hypothetical protein n=1 Tax=Inquilinus limosus TaxID=171674 RepID=UPI00068F6E8A|nr:hypothetical protein [Inquilinus limosus]